MAKAPFGLAWPDCTAPGRPAKLMPGSVSASFLLRLLIVSGALPLGAPRLRRFSSRSSGAGSDPGTGLDAESGELPHGQHLHRVSDEEQRAFAACIVPRDWSEGKGGVGAVDDPYTTCRLSTGGTQAWVARIRGAGLRDAGGSEVGAQLVITQGLDTPYCAESYYRRHTHQGVKRHCVAFGGDFGKPVIPTRWPVMAFTHPWGVNFEHFHMEHLPRLALYLQSKSALPGLKLAVVSDGYGSVGLSSWQRMAFEIAGVDVETDVFVPKRRRDGTTRMFETLLIPGFVGSDVPHPIGLDMLVQYHERAQAMSRNRTHARPRPSSISGAGARSPSTSPSLTASDKPVYFTRRDAKSGAARKMTNEKELEKQLEALGWDVLTFGDYTLLERVEILSRRKLVVMPIGSGIANMLYCPATAQLVLICTPNLCQREGVYHYTLARALGMPGPIYLGEFAHAKGFPETETEFATTVDNGKGGLQSAYSVKLDKLVLKLKELAAA